MNKERTQMQSFENKRIDLFTICYDIAKNFWVVIAGMIAALFLAYVIGNVMYVPEYRASTTFVATEKNSSYIQASKPEVYDTATMFEKVLKSNMMRKIICEELNLDRLDAEITTSVQEDTNVVVLNVTDKSPKEAFDIMNVIIDNYSTISFYSVGSGILQVLQAPKIPMEPVNPKNIDGWMLKAAAAAGALLIVILGVMSYMSDTIKQEEDIEEKLDARSLGSIGFEQKYKTIKELVRNTKYPLLVTNPLVGFRFVEEYRKLAAKIEYLMTMDKQKVLVVTSLSENEGKSTVASNLAISLAEKSKRVLLIDGDFRRPSQFLIFQNDVETSMELGEFLNGNQPLRNIIQKSRIKGLFIALGKTCYGSSMELLQNGNMKTLVDTLKETVDYIIIDSPPVGLMGDAEVLGEYADAVMLVEKQHFMLAEDINDVIDRFRAQNTKVLGVLLNNVKSFSFSLLGSDFGQYGKYSKYGKYSRKGNE